jgi:YD repeat-containing protein
MGRITALTETIAGERHGCAYDAAGRLECFTTDVQSTATLDYDPNGNRIQLHSQDIASYDDQDRLQSYDATHTRPVPPGAPSSIWSMATIGAWPRRATARSPRGWSIATTLRSPGLSLGYKGSRFLRVTSTTPPRTIAAPRNWIGTRVSSRNR